MRQPGEQPLPERTLDDGPWEMPQIREERLRLIGDVLDEQSQDPNYMQQLQEEIDAPPTY